MGNLVSWGVVYSLAITIAAGLVLLALLGGGLLFARRLASEGASSISFGSWRWQPSLLALLVLAPLGVLILWRFFPALLFVPFVLPFFLRRGLFNSFWRRRDGGDGPIEGRFRRDDDE